MSQLKAKLKDAMKEAMKAREAARLQTIRMALSVIQKKEVDEQKDLDDAGVEKILLTTLKQLQESAEQAVKANRDDLKVAAEAEMLIVKEFLPQQMSEDEVSKITDQIVAEMKSSGTLPTGPAAMGLVMKQAMAKIGSRSEGKVVQAAVKKSLGM
jgi:uncharacterized protein YqeY